MCYFYYTVFSPYFQRIDKWGENPPYGDRISCASYKDGLLMAMLSPLFTCKQAVDMIALRFPEAFSPYIHFQEAHHESFSPSKQCLSVCM